MKKLLLLATGIYISLLMHAQTPVAYYPFKGNANDAAGSLNGTVNGGVTLTTDRFGNANSAYSFDGVDDFISISRTMLLNGLTFEAWIKTTSNDNSAGYAGNSALSVIGDHDNDIFTSFGITGGKVNYHHHPNLPASWNSVTGTTSVNDGNWHHIAITHALSGSITLYVDGIINATATINYNTINTAFDRVGGSYFDAINTGDFFNGSIDEVKIYNTALTAQQINDLYIKGEICNGFDDDNDGLIDEACIPTVSIANKSLAEGNSDTTDMKFAVTLDHPYDSIVSVRYKTANKTAIAGSDYVAINKVLKFNPGQVKKTVTISVLGDITVEPNEQFNVILLNPVNAILGSSDTAIGTIRNDDAAFAVTSNTTDALKNISVSISPNPAKNQLHITGLTNSTAIQVMDLQGRILLKQNISSNAPINISALTPGVYMIRYTEGNNYKTIKFIKE